MPGTPTVLHPVVSGLPLSGSDYNDNAYLVEQSFGQVSSYLVSGLVPTIGTGLSVNISAGIAVTVAYLSLAGFVIGSLAPSTTNFLFLNPNGTGTANTTGTPPAGALRLGTCLTGVGTVTSVNTNRSSGRQAYVRPELRVPGGPGAGNPPSISLAAAAAAAADGVTLFGVLPAASLPADVAFIDVGNVFSVTQVVTPSSTSRCLTLNHKNGVGATVFLTSNNAVDATWRTLVNFGSKFQFGTDSLFNGTADWFIQNQTTGNIVLTISAADLLTLGTAAAGATVPGALTLSGLTAQTVTDAATAIETSFLTLTHHSSGTPAAGFGTAIEFDGDDSANITRRMGKCAVSWKTATSGATVSQIELTAAAGGSFVPCLIADGTQLVTIPGSLAHTGAAGSQKIGFYAATPVIQQANASAATIAAVTDANAKAALQALYNALKNYGLCPATA